MAKVIGVQFQKNGKMYYFDPADFEPKLGDYVIVDTVRGLDLGETVLEARDLALDESAGALKSMVRFATAQDIQTSSDNRIREKEAYGICQKKIAEHQLEMKLVSVEYAFDGSKILFYFTANGRVDFRSLVKDLASVFKTRIELRQIGVRDEARMLGGLGPCGRPICCGAFLNDFQPVSIKMAKEQNLSLNPAKISGVCGRLMCCLKYEQDHYEQTRKKMPRVGREVSTPDGTGQVVDLNIIRETVSVRIVNGDSSEIKSYSLEEISRSREKQQAANGQGNAQEPVPASQQVPEEGVSTSAVPAPRAENSSSATSVSGGKRSSGRPRQEHAEEKKKNPDHETPRSRPERQLGQPVRRENPRKQSEASREKVTVAGESRSSWADQLQQAMHAIESNEQKQS